MNKTVLFGAALLMFGALLWGLLGCSGDKSEDGNVNQAPSPIKIGILYTEPHPVLTTIADAFKAEVRSAAPTAVFIERHGSGSKAQYPATVRAVLAEGVDLLAPITTPMSLEALKQAEGRVPVVFLGVTDPVGAELVESLLHPERCSGVSDNPPMAGVVDLFLQFFPKGKKVGIPYDPRDQPGVATANRAAEDARSRGLEAVLRPVTSETELRAAVRGLASEVDAVVIGMDNLMMKNAGIISRTVAEQNLALFAADDKSVEMGALAGVGVDYADVGRLGGQIAIEVLMGKKPIGDIPVRSLSSGQIFFNTETAELLGLSIPPSVLEVGRAVNE